MWNLRTILHVPVYAYPNMSYKLLTHGNRKTEILLKIIKIEELRIKHSIWFKCHIKCLILNRTVNKTVPSATT